MPTERRAGVRSETGRSVAFLLPAGLCSQTAQTNLGAAHRHAALGTLAQVGWRVEVECRDHGWPASQLAAQPQLGARLGVVLKAAAPLPQLVDCSR